MKAAEYIGSHGFIFSPTSFLVSHTTHPFPFPFSSPPVRKWDLALPLPPFPAHTESGKITAKMSYSSSSLDTNLAQLSNPWQIKLLFFSLQGKVGRAQRSLSHKGEIWKSPPQSSALPQKRPHQEEYFLIFLLFQTNNRLKTGETDWLGRHRNGELKDQQQGWKPKDVQRRWVAKLTKK